MIKFKGFDPNNIDKDKLLHFFWSAVLMIPLMIIFGVIGGSVLLFVIAVLKEIIHDKWLKRGNCETMDAIYGTLPAIIYLIIHYVQIFKENI